MKSNNMVKRVSVACRQILIFSRLKKLLYSYPLICSGSDVFVPVDLASVRDLDLIVLHCVCADDLKCYQFI